MAQVQAQPLWTRAIVTSGNGSAVAGAMVLDAAGNVYVGGTDENGYLTLKLSPAGDLLWSTRTAGRSGWYRTYGDIAVDDIGSVYVTGGLAGLRSHTFTWCDFFEGCKEYREYAPDLYTIKYNDRGRRQWEVAYPESGDGYYYFAGSDIVVDPAGNSYAVGYTISPPPGIEIYITGTRTIKYNAAGQQVWVKTNSPLSASYLTSFRGSRASLDREGNLCLTGVSGTRKLDPNGNELWSAPIKGTTLQLDDADDLYVTTDVGPTTKLAPGGQVLWAAPFGGVAATLDNAGNLFVADFRSNPQRANYVTTKLDGQGRAVWRAIDDLGSSGYPTSLVADGEGNVYVTGYSGTVKYDANGIRVWRTPPSYAHSLIALDAAGYIIVASGNSITKFTQTVAPGAPVITTPPHHPLVRAGESVTLSVSVTGNSPLAYQWRKTDGVIFAATNETLTIENVQTNTAGLYTVEVTNLLGSAAAPGVFVNLLGPLPSQTVVRGATAIFTTPLIGGGPAAFQWQFNGVNLPGEDSPTLLITNAMPAHAGDYTVVVSNYYGNALTSTVARLEVDTRVTQMWAATVPAANVGDVGQALGVDAAGNVFVAGYSDCGHKTVKFDAAGAKLWEACDGNYGTLGGLVVDSSGNVCITGTQYTTNAGYDIVTIKYSSAGIALWTARFDGASGSNDVASAIAVDSAGNFYVAGDSVVGTNGYDFITVKYSPGGEQLWAARYDGPAHGDDVATAVAVDSSGNVFVGGASTSTNQWYNFAVVRYTSSGTPIWTNRYDGPAPGNDVPSDIAVDTIGNVYVTGWSPGQTSRTDFATIKYDPNGSQLWIARYNGPGNGEDNPHGLAVDAGGSVYVSGSSVRTNWPPPQGEYDIATVKYAPDGTQLWLQRYHGPGNGNDYSRALALDDAGNVYVGGHSDVVPGSPPVTEVVTLSYDGAGNPRWVARYETGIESGPYYRNGSLLVNGAGTVYVADTTFTGLTPAFLTLKYVQPATAGIRLMAPAVTPGGQFRCALRGEAGVRYTIQVSSDLVNWTPLAEVVATTGGTEFTDTTLPGQSHRFYRAVQP